MTTPTVNVRKATEEEIAFATSSQPAVEQKNPEGTRPATQAEIDFANGDILADESWYEDKDMVAKATLDGITLGFGDELGAAVAAGIAKMTGAGGDASYGEIYQDIRRDIVDRSNEWEAAHPTAALALNVGGGLLTAPVSVAGGVATGVKTAAKAVGAGTKSLTARGTALGTGLAVEGAIAGVGFAQPDSDLTTQAAEGAITSAVLGGVLNRVGAGVRGITSRKVAEDLGEGASFKPLNLAADGNLQKFYSRVIGHNISLGRGLLRQQSERWLQPLQDNVEKLRRIGGKRASQLVAREQERLLGDDSILERRIKKTIRQPLKELTEESKNRIAANDVKTEAMRHARMLRMQEAVIAEEKAFRRNIVKASMSSNMDEASRKSFMDLLDNPNTTMQDINTALGENWQKFGYNFIKERKFRFGDKFLNNVISEVEADMAPFRALNGTAPVNVLELMGDVIDTQTNRGWITGEDLSRLRSRISQLRQSAGFDGAGAASRRMLGTLQDKINTHIKNQLSDSGKKMFDAENAAWKVRSAFEDSVKKASTKPGQRGAFSPSDWLSVSASNNPYQFSRGTAPFQKQADSLGDLAKRSDEVITKAAEHAKKLKADNLTREQQLLQKKINELDADVTYEAGAYAEGVKNKATAYENAIKELEAMKEVLPAEKGYSSLFQLSAALGGMYVDASTALTAAGASRLLAEPAIQKIVAGQTVAQKKVFDLLQKAPTEAIRSSVVRGQIGSDARDLSSNEIARIARKGTDEEKQALFRQLGSQKKLEEIRKVSPQVFEVLQKSFTQTSPQ